MIYDVTIVAVRPGTHPAALARLNETLAETQSAGEFLACWYSEIGALNRILLLRRYEDEAACLADRRAILQKGNPFGLGEFSAGMTMDTYVPFPVREKIEAGEFGPIYEVRTYVFKPDGLSPTIELWNRHVPARVKISPLLAAMYSVSGTVTRFMHIWPYRSLDERQRLRTQSVSEGVWPPPGGPAHLAQMQNDIYLPAPFSPLR
jgi:NIPSNAP